MNRKERSCCPKIYLLLIVVLAASAHANPNTVEASPGQELLLKHKTIRIDDIEASEFLQAMAFSHMAQWLVKVVDAENSDTLQQIEYIIGHSVEFYVPHDGYVFVTTTDRVQKVRQLPGVLWIGSYRPEYKTESFTYSSGEFTFTESHRCNSSRYTITVFARNADRKTSVIAEEVPLR